MRIAFLGDIALIGKYDLTLKPNAKDRLINLAKKLKNYDYIVGNLESPITKSIKTCICKSMHLRSSLESVEILKFLNIDAVSLANNHIYDFGKKGLKDTIKILEDNGIEWFGINSKQLIKKIESENICFSGFCCYSTNGIGYKMKRKIGINTLTYDNVLKQLDHDEKNNMFSVLSFHWGTEHTNYPMYSHILLARKLAVKKNIIIHGHHPHVIQGVKKINGSLVAYSLGNCLFDDCTSLKGNFSLKQNRDNKKSFILEVEIKDGEIINYDFHGFKDEEVGIDL